MEDQIKAMLDQLDDFYAMKDSIAAAKKSQLDEIKVPAEVLAAQDEANRKAQEFEASARREIEAIRKAAEDELAQVQIPEEIRAALAEIDRKRQEIRAAAQQAEERVSLKSSNNRAVLFTETRKKTEDIYRELEERKREIAAEFAGKEEAAEANIKRLEAEIKAAAKEHGKTVKGKYFSAVYVKGRVTWNTDKMEAWIIDHPFLREARKEGEPSITLRRN